MITIAESPVLPGVIWVGTDDGNVQLTRDGGRSWTNLRPRITGVPARTWVSRVEASRFDPAVAYVAFDGHRSDDFRPYVFRTADYGRTWASLSAGLPADEPVYAVEEDTRNPRLLYLGTERGVWMTRDGGARWQRMGGFPVVPVHDLVLHPRVSEIWWPRPTAGASGSSMTPGCSSSSPTRWAAEVPLFQNRVATRWRGVTRGAERGHLYFDGRNPWSQSQVAPQNSPSELETFASIDVWLRQAPAGKVRLEIGPLGGEMKYTGELDGTAGLNRFRWNMRWNPPPAPPRPAALPPGMEGEEGFTPFRPRGEEAPAGSYRVRLTVGATTREVIVTLRDDPGAP